MLNNQASLKQSDYTIIEIKHYHPNKYLIEMNKPKRIKCFPIFQVLFYENKLNHLQPTFFFF